MKTTPDNLDDMDCRPLGRETGIKVSAETQKNLDAVAAIRRDRSPKRSERPSSLLGRPKLAAE